MYKGYYTLTSGMLTQNKNLSVISNNITNVSTPGFKRDTLVPTTFQTEMLSRYGNQSPNNSTELGEITMANVPEEVVTDYSTGGFEDTGNIYDFSLSRDGFFQVQGENGVVYTRNGAFIVDNERYLTLPRVGRVLGENGPIQLNTDTFQVDSMGIITDGDQVIDRLAIVDFEDYTQLRKAGEGIFEGGGEPIPVEEDAVRWQSLENSNVSMLQEMTNMITSQRAIQSAAQLLKIYDQIMAKSTTDIGRV